jgi:hypothetical protein
MSPLDGGPKDEQAPSVLSSFPDSAQTNVQTDEISLTFDEYIKAQDMRNLLILSPRLENGLETQIKGRKLTIRFKDSLRPNTTYNLQLNGSVVDNNEGNPLEDYQLFFSTGDYIDSLRYSAVVFNAFDRTACEECIVALYSSEKDSIILTQTPEYIGRTSKTGRIHISNLAEQNLRAIAIEDKNKNLKLDNDEQVSLFQIAQIQDSMTTDTFYVFPYSRQPKLKTTLHSSYPGKLQVVFNRGVEDSIAISAFDQNLDYTTSITLDTLTTYFSIAERDSFDVVVQVDSISDSLIYQAPLASVNKGIQASWAYDGTPRLHLPTPGKTLIDKFQLIQDSVGKEFNLVEQSQRLEFKGKWDRTKTLYLIMKDSAFQDISGRYSQLDTMGLSYIASKATLDLQIELSDTVNHLFELYQDQRVFQRRILTSNTSIFIRSLAPGTYRVRIIKDSNQNGRWDQGDVFLNSKSEELYLSEEFELRENWDNSLIIKY